MATNDRFIQSIVELLDRLIDHQSRSSNLLTEIKLATIEVRTDLSETLRQLREKLPDVISSTSEESNKQLADLLEKLQESSNYFSKQAEAFEKGSNLLEDKISENTLIIKNNQNSLASISLILAEKEKEKKELEQTLKEVQGFISNLKSKKAWVALIVALVVGFATFLSALTNAAEGIREYLGYNQTATQVSPSSQPGVSAKPKP